MTEHELICESFINTIISNKTNVKDLFLTLKYKDNTEKDIIPDNNTKLSSLLSSTLLDTKVTNSLKEIEIKSQEGLTIETLNKIQID